jgi:hypothetical protein
MTTVNPSVLLRSLIIYAICVPLAVIVGYLLTNPEDRQTIGFIAVLTAVLIFPLLMKWHYPLLIFSCSFPGVVFFLPGHPNWFLTMVAISLGISVIERILSRNRHFLPAGGVGWPLLAMLCVVFMTAKLTGGFGLRAMGSDVYGGKKYVFLVVGIMSFFAFIVRPIPRAKVNLYLALFFISGMFSIVSDLYSFIPSYLHFIYMVIPPSSLYTTPGADSLELGVTRLTGVSSTAAAVFFWMLARHGFRDAFVTGKLWRPLLMFALVPIVMLGGFRSSLIGLMMMVSLIFFLEKMHRTGVMLVVTMVALAGAVLIIPLASHLPFTYQRALAFLPLDISPEARMSADTSTEWRLEMWKALLPQVPQYLFKGKGYAFSRATFDEMIGTDAAFHNLVDASQDPLALAGDFHSGPLSVVIPFGIWGVITLFWFWAMGFRVVLRNYRYGDPSLRHINVFLLASFVSKIFGFLFIFGSFSDDIGPCAMYIGLSIAFNHGVMGPRVAPQVNAARAKSELPFGAQLALPR